MNATVIYVKIIVSFLYWITVTSATTLNSPTCIPDTTYRDSWSKEDYPNPQINTGQCGRNCKTSWVCDPGHVIPSHKADQLDSLIHTVLRSGICDCSQCEYPDGYNISIALVPSINRTSGSDATTEAKYFAHHLRNNWNFQKCGNNIVIFVSRDDRQVYTEVGPKAHQILTSKCIDDIYNTARPIFTHGDYYEGLKEMINSYKEALDNGNCVHASKDMHGIEIGIIVGIAFGGFFMLFIVAFVCITRRKEGGCHGGAMVNGHHYPNGSHSWNGSSGVGFSGGGGGGGGSGGGGGGGDGGGGGGGGF